MSWLVFCWKKTDACKGLFGKDVRYFEGRRGEDGNVKQKKLIRRGETEQIWCFRGGVWKFVCSKTKWSSGLKTPKSTRRPSRPQVLLVIQLFFLVMAWKQLNFLRQKFQNVRWETMKISSQNFLETRSLKSLRFIVRRFFNYHKSARSFSSRAAAVNEHRERFFLSFSMRFKIRIRKEKNDRELEKKRIIFHTHFYFFHYSVEV